MYKDLKLLKNKLYNMGNLSEANAISNMIKLSRDFGAEREYSDVKDGLPKSYTGDFEWPWELWSSLSDPAKEEFYDILDILSWIPILGVGAQSATFTLKCFEGDWKGAGYALVWIILSFYMAKQLKAGVSLMKKTGKIMTDSMKEIAKDLTLKSLVIDFATNSVNELLTIVADAFDNSQHFKEIAQHLNAEKPNIKKYINSEISKYLV